MKKVILSFVLLVMLVNVYYVIDFNSKTHISKDLKVGSYNNDGMDYLYDSTKIDYISFMIIFENKEGTVKAEDLGRYYLNNDFNIYTMNPFNLINKVLGNVQDSGIINIRLFNDENGILLDCYSDIKHSNPITLSKVNLFEEISFEDYTFEYVNKKTNRDTFLMMEGFNKKDSSTITLYASFYS